MSATLFENAFTAESAISQQPWLQAFRAQQFQKFSERGLPTKREEWWKYIDLGQLEKSNFSMPAQSEQTAHAYASTLQNTIRLVFVNGYFSEALSNNTLLPPDVILVPLSKAIKSYEDIIKPYLLKPLNEQRYPFASLNAALMSEGVFLQVPKNCVVTYPIHLVFISTGQYNFISSPRNIVIINENAEVKMIEEYTSLQAENYFTNAITELHVSQNAQVNYYKLQNEHASATHIANINVHQSQGSIVNLFSTDCGSRLAREDFNIRLQERGAICHMSGLYFTNQDAQQVDNHIYADHAATHCTSSMLYKGILNKKSQAVFNGKVYAHPGAQQTNAQQANHNLLLSPDAEVNTKPELEIYADDVKCVHGATVGQLDQDALFYLRARGIEKDEALKLIRHAFVEEVLQTIADSTIREYIQQRVSGYAEH